nr:PREDICTED: myosin-11-like isoform X2 [Lepisosteus oculatus]
MKRFLMSREDFELRDQIQLLTEKCNVLEGEKVLKRECLVAGEQARTLRMDVNSLSMQLCIQEQRNMALQVKHDQLLRETQHEKELADFLQQQLQTLAKESAKNSHELGQELEKVLTDLHQLQDSETQLQNLLEEMQQQNQERTRQAEQLQAELNSKTQELDEERSLHAEILKQMRQKNQGSLKKLQVTVIQFESFCEQQKTWMHCVKRFKDCMSEEKDALWRKINTMEKQLQQFRRIMQENTKYKAFASTAAETANQHYDRLPMVDPVLLAEGQAEINKWNRTGDLCKNVTPLQETNAIDGHQKPP